MLDHGGAGPPRYLDRLMRVQRHVLVLDPTDFLRSTVQHSTVPYGGANTLAPHIITREKFALENYRRCLYILRSQVVQPAASRVSHGRRTIGIALAMHPSLVRVSSSSSLFLSLIGNEKLPFFV